MSVVLPAERGAWWAVAGPCRYCGEPIGDEPAVMWSTDGDGGVILHGGCARALGTHLIADSRECELAAGRHPWTRRAARALRSALLTGERSA
jgi:hypothetical protein